MLRDLSACGAAIHSRSLLSLQAEVRLCFRLPGDGRADDLDLELSCLVVRTAAIEVPVDGLCYLTGLHFLTLPDKSFERVREFVWNRLTGKGRTG